VLDDQNEPTPHKIVSHATKYISLSTRQTLPVSVFVLSTSLGHTVEAVQRIEMGLSRESVCCGKPVNLTLYATIAL